MIEEVKKQVADLLSTDNSGHGMDHINRVHDLAVTFALKEDADKTVVSLIALLHDVDDYKLFGEESAKNLTNAKKILSDNNVDMKVQEQVLSEIKSLGYSKRLQGIEPKTIEGKIASDADMCDALGATGIIRVHSFGMKINRPFFRADIFPTDEIDLEHHVKGNSSTINFIIATLLDYKSRMLTTSGKEEASKRHEIIVRFLYQFFEEENVPAWSDYLTDYLNQKYF